MEKKLANNCSRVEKMKKKTRFEPNTAYNIYEDYDAEGSCQSNDDGDDDDVNNPYQPNAARSIYDDDDEDSCPSICSASFGII